MTADAQGSLKKDDNEVCQLKMETRLATVDCGKRKLLAASAAATCEVVWH
jgi:hypothetical protein